MEVAKVGPTASNHTVLDWLNLHGFDSFAVTEALSSLRASPVAAPLDTLEQPLSPSAEDVWKLTSLALAEFLPEMSGEIDFVKNFCERIFDASPTELPYTLDRGRDQTPIVSMCYQGTPSNALCIAHEFGHALQYNLTQGCFVPPVLRELAAFIAENILIDFTQQNHPNLYAPFHTAWQNDNGIYFGDDAEKLQEALKKPATPYFYRMNYPLARYLANEIFETLPRSDLVKVFRGTLLLPELLSTLQNQKGAYNRDNQLPHFPDAEKDGPAINAYRTLGAMALLDINCLQGEAEKSVEEYYSTRLGHMQAQTAFVAIDGKRKPIGYATWEADPNEANLIRLQSQVTPFGNQLEFQKKLQEMFPENATVLSYHSSSVREKQVT